MPLFIRKINKSKWLQEHIPLDKDIPADAITNCMKTDYNTLSVWQVTNEGNIDEAALALVAGGYHLDSIDVVPMNSEYLKENEIDCIPSKGRTEVEDLADTHLNLSNLSYRKLGIIAYHTVEKIREDKVKRYTRGRLKEILNEAIEKGRLKKEDLEPSISKKL